MEEQKKIELTKEDWVKLRDSAENELKRLREDEPKRLMIAVLQYEKLLALSNEELLKFDEKEDKEVEKTISEIENETEVTA